MRQFLGQALADLALFVTGSFQCRARPRGRESRVAPAIRLLWVPPQQLGFPSLHPDTLGRSIRMFP